MENTKKRNIIFTLLFVAGVFLVLVLLDIREIMDYSKIEAAGKKTLIPVNVKQETSTRRYKGRTTKTITNYVQFTVKINNKKRSFWMKTSDAYGENSPSAGIQAVASKKKIERYIFYTENSIYYSKEASTTEEYIEESIKGKLLVFFIFMVILGVIFLVTYIADIVVKKRRMKLNN